MQPSPSKLPLRSGIHLLQFQGFDATIVNGTLVPACPGLSAARIGNVATYVEVEQSGSRWRARPQTEAGGTFEMWLYDGPVDPEHAPSSEIGIVAIASGTVINTRMPAESGDRVLLGTADPSSFGGGISRDGVIASGLVASRVQFANSLGQAVSCNPRTVLWSLSRTTTSAARDAGNLEVIIETVPVTVDQLVPDLKNRLAKYEHSNIIWYNG